MWRVYDCRVFSGEVLVAPYHCVLLSQVYEGGPHLVRHSQQMEGLQAWVAGQSVVPGLAGVLALGALRGAARNTSCG